MIPPFQHVDSAGALFMFIGFMTLITGIMMFILSKEDKEEATSGNSFLDQQEAALQRWTAQCESQEQLDTIEHYARRISDNSKEPPARIFSFRESVGKALNLHRIYLQLKLNHVTLQR